LLEFVFGPLNETDGIVGVDCWGPVGEFVQPDIKSPTAHTKRMRFVAWRAMMCSSIKTDPATRRTVFLLVYSGDAPSTVYKNVFAREKVSRGFL
jgi:hypothetical protein